MRSRLATALAGFLASILLSVVAWLYLDLPVFLLFLPFVPFLFRSGQQEPRPPVRECPECGFRTREGSYEYCPRDGRRLE